MTRPMAALAAVAIAAAALTLDLNAQDERRSYVNFEGAQTAPIRLSADGEWLYAVNTADARLSVFSLADPDRPRLVAEIPVGLEPVSANPRTNDEVWVVNQVSDSVSIVSVSRGIVVDTLYVKDEPADVVFAGSDLAFVSAARSNEIRVFGASSRTPVRTIPLLGHHPRALAVNAAGTKVYAAFALSGNRTTIIPFPFAPPQPPPSSPELPPAPQVGRIVDAADPNWAPLVKYRVVDSDVVEIDARLLIASRYHAGAGTVNLGLAVRPGTDELWVANTDARNLVRFEPNLRGHFVDNRVTRIRAAGPPVAYDLNPSIDYGVLPNPAALGTALAQPTSVVFDPGGQHMYVAAFGTDRVAVVGADGMVRRRIDVTPAGATNSRAKRGPRGLALNAGTQRLYVLNRISNSISVIHTGTHAVVREVPVGSFDPTPVEITEGRGFLYDAKLSGNGTGSCASCHVDGDMDFLAWDLGDPGGRMQTVTMNGAEFPMHPMKGPMTTQTLRGLAGMQPFHWRGDRADFEAFNGAFDSLMGGAPIPDEDMAAFTRFIDTLTFQPNPHQNLDRTLPSSLAGGNPSAGLNTFVNETYRFPFTCNTCHRITPGPGTANTIQFVQGQIQPFKVPHLRNVYQKVGYANHWGAIAINGFGLLNEGSVSDLFELVSQPQFHRFADDTPRKLNLMAFVLSFDTGTAPAVGYTRTFEAADLSSAAALGDWVLLQTQAGAGNIDLIVRGTIDGRARGLLYRPGMRLFVSDSPDVGPFTGGALWMKIAAGDVLTMMGVPPGSGVRMGIDRDLDGVPDGAEP
jgi:YVTN family beta-propeller protein